MPNSKPAAAYLSGVREMQKKFNKTERILTFPCKKGEGFKSARCLVGRITCNCPLDVIEVKIEGSVTFPEGAEEVALREFGLSRLYTINQS